MILFLYTELAGYTISCLQALAKHTSVHVVHWPVNPEAPFNLSTIPNCTFTEKQPHAFLPLSGGEKEGVSASSFQLIISSGWIDKSYLRFCKAQKKKGIPTVLTMDNHWTGSLKQQLLTLASPFYLQQIFTHCWVPGEPQKKYAKKLHFKEDNIQTGFYSANTPYFAALYHKYKAKKEQDFPKKFICVARYIPQKNLRVLWEAFIAASSQTGSDWELWNLGFGEEYDQRVQHPQLKHHGFVQPGDMEQFIAGSGVFVLPSLFEPWGVVVHEFAAAGFPMLLSNKVGAATAFLEEGKNGYTFNPENKEELTRLLVQLMKTNTSNLLTMGSHSHTIAQRLTPEKWANTVLSFCT